MIVVLNWQTFHALYLNQVCYVKEHDDSWEIWTSDSKLFNIKCVVEKSENQEENIMFIDRYFADRKNIIKVIDIIPEGTQTQEKVPMTSNEAIPEDPYREEETEETDEECHDRVMDESQDLSERTHDNSDLIENPEVEEGEDELE